MQRVGNKMNTCTIILPMDRKRSAQLLALMEMFSKTAVIPLREIEKTIPRSTFYSLLYKLKLLAQIVREKHGFDLFVFEKLLDFNSMKELKADFKNLGEIKVMKLNAEMRIVDLEGNIFVEFAKVLDNS